MMTVGCGRCRTQFPVDGPGRYGCPACGAVNEVRPAADPEPGLMVPPPAPEPVAASPRVTCAGCSFSFIVGDIDVASCPNCGADVPVRSQP